MKSRILHPALGVAAMVLACTLIQAAQAPAPPTATPTGKAKPAVVETRTKGKLKPVDINHAHKNELSFMLGIDEALAAKIVANRPYKTKADLVVKKVFSMALYQQLRKKVMAG
jgi:DNA uptake protein ComE-like DNA-binding protein